MCRSITLSALAAVLIAAAGCAGNTPRSDTAARPADAQAHTQPGLYLRHADAEAWDRRQRGSVVWVDTACCAAGDVDLAVMLAYGVQAKNLGDDAPFFVTGADPRFAARVVDRLARNGVRQAFLVTP